MRRRVCKRVNVRECSHLLMCVCGSGQMCVRHMFVVGLCVCHVMFLSERASPCGNGCVNVF